MSDWYKRLAAQYTTVDCGHSAYEDDLRQEVWILEKRIEELESEANNEEATASGA